jgi:hypothetical protein
MAKKLICASIFFMVIYGVAFSQNRLANTTWETVTSDGNHQTIVFGENGFRWTGESFRIRNGLLMPGRNEVGTYEVQGEMVYLSTPGINYTGILIGNTLNISMGGLVGWEFRRVNGGTPLGPSNTQSLPSIRIKNGTGYTIHYMYIIPINNSSWGKNVLGNKILRAGETIDVPLSQPINVVNRYHILLIDVEEDTYTKKNIQITANMLIEFTMSDLDLR